MNSRNRFDVLFWNPVSNFKKSKYRSRCFGKSKIDRKIRRYNNNSIQFIIRIMCVGREKNLQTYTYERERVIIMCLHV